MGERKVLNKYYPADFDPEQIPRNKKSRDRQIAVRIMIPFTMFCTECSEIMYRATKFNSRKAIAQEINYLGITIYRFFIKCPRCTSQIVFRTDPENADYVLEHGGMRKQEIWDGNRDPVSFDVHMSTVPDEEIELDDMEALTLAVEKSKKVANKHQVLEDLHALNNRHAAADTTMVLQRLHKARTDEGTSMCALDVERAVLDFRRQVAELSKLDEAGPPPENRKVAAPKYPLTRLASLASRMPFSSADGRLRLQSSKPRESLPVPVPRQQHATLHPQASSLASLMFSYDDSDDDDGKVQVTSSSSSPPSSPTSSSSCCCSCFRCPPPAAPQAPSRFSTSNPPPGMRGEAMQEEAPDCGN